MSNTEKMVIKTLNKPQTEKVDDLLEWFCDVFDLDSGGKAVEPGILKEITISSMTGEGVTSKALNLKLEMPRSTVIYHINRFIYSGLVVRKGRKYYLRSTDMASTMEEMQSDMLREFNRLIEFADRLDKIMESDLNDSRQKRRKR